MNSPIASIVIPAYNEERVIGRCLAHMLDNAAPGELEIIVVCNGCHDSTAARAREFAAYGITVLETKVASKTNALNIGDAAAIIFPRLYVDADIQLSILTIRSMVELFQKDHQVLLCAPRPVVDYSRSDGRVRAFYRVWTRLPYFTEVLIGSGVYAFSREGRARFGVFPDIIADDEYARRIVRPDQRRSSAGNFVISAPRSLTALINIQTRARAGTYELEKKFPELKMCCTTSPRRTVKVIAKTPSMWLDAPIYLAVMFAAKLRAHKKLASTAAHAWNRDETARAMASEVSCPIAGKDAS